MENIRYELRPPIAVVTLDRPKVLNALNHLSMTELEQVFLDIRQNDDVRAVLLTGAGRRPLLPAQTSRSWSLSRHSMGSGPLPAGRESLA